MERCWRIGKMGLKLHGPIERLVLTVPPRVGVQVVHEVVAGQDEHLLVTESRESLSEREVLRLLAAPSRRRGRQAQAPPALDIQRHTVLGGTHQSFAE
jgi:hypothetical protein